MSHTLIFNFSSIFEDPDLSCFKSFFKETKIFFVAQLGWLIFYRKYSVLSPYFKLHAVAYVNLTRLCNNKH